MSKILRVNMQTKTVTSEDLHEKYEKLGGRALVGRIILDEVAPACHPLGAQNKLVIAPGLLSGTIAPSSGRLSVGAKSPLTQGIKESNSGGPVAGFLAKLGIRALIIEDKPSEDEFYILCIGSKGAEILKAPEELIGLGCYDTVTYVHRNYALSDKSAVMSIGPAGEMRAAAACISLTNMEGMSSRQCGRGGMGAVMGAKRIKAIIIDPCGMKMQSYNDPIAFRKVAQEMCEQLVTSTVGLNQNGTAQLVTPINNVGALPVRNFSIGSWDKYEKITGQEIHRLSEQRGGRWGHACQPGCCIRCSNIYVDKEGRYVTGSLEYETVALFGANCLIDDLDAIAEIDYICDDLGVDTIDTAIACGILMESGELEWGDKDGVKKLLLEIGKKSVMGRLIASGTNIVGRVMGQWRTPQSKGQSIAAYDPRGCKGTGVTYWTSTMGGDHTSGNALPGRGISNPQAVERQACLSRNLQIYCAYMLDSTGICLFTGPTAKRADMVAGLLNYKYGWNFSAEDIYQRGVEVLKTELAFNRAAGIPDIDITEFFTVEALSPHQQCFDIDSSEMSKVYDFTYEFPEEQWAIF
jgi:aldehyde:ferredoxin oxidoreductase